MDFILTMAIIYGLLCTLKFLNVRNAYIFSDKEEAEKEIKQLIGMIIIPIMLWVDLIILNLVCDAILKLL